MSSPIHYATSVDAVRLLLEQGANIYSGDQYGRTALHNSVRDNNIDLVRLFVDWGIDINIACRDFGRSPLHYAAQGGHTSMVVYLLDKGANPSLEELNGYTPIGIGKLFKHPDVVNVIQRHMATKVISEGLRRLNLSDRDHSYMTERIYNACSHYARTYTLSNESTLTHILYLKIDYVIKKLTPSLIKKIIDETDPLRIKTLLMNELYTYDKELQDEREAIINKEQACMVEDKWESARQCPRCRQRKYKVRQVITRCIDEGTTMKADCICGNTFML